MSLHIDCNSFKLIITNVFNKYILDFNNKSNVINISSIEILLQIIDNLL